MTFVGKLIKRARNKKHLSQGYVSKLLGYGNPQYISNIERGLCVFPVAKGKQFCKIVGIPDLKLKKAILNDYKNWIDEKWV